MPDLNVILIILGFFAFIVPCYEILRNRHNKFLSATLIIIGIAIIGVSIKKLGNEKKEEIAKKLEISKLQSQVAQVNSKMTADSTRDVDFQKKLWIEFKIIRDSVTNNPMKFNTEIHEARDVFIGPR